MSQLRERSFPGMQCVSKVIKEVDKINSSSCSPYTGLVQGDSAHPSRQYMSP